MNILADFTFVEVPIFFLLIHDRIRDFNNFVY
jgi:hypothetical protein